MIVIFNFYLTLCKMINEWHLKGNKSETKTSLKVSATTNKKKNNKK